MEKDGDIKSIKLARRRYTGLVHIPSPAGSQRLGPLTTTPSLGDDEVGDS